MQNMLQMLCTSMCHLDGFLQFLILEYTEKMQDIVSYSYCSTFEKGDTQLQVLTKVFEIKYFIGSLNHLYKVKIQRYSPIFHMRKLRIDIVNDALELTSELATRNKPIFLIFHSVALSRPPAKIKHEYKCEFLQNFNNTS